ncbi:MAG: adenylate cyclase [marine bacterium B5-7]|nr:MAG: adenylate cyclase [marine bacterium B5-7]
MSQSRQLAAIMFTDIVGYTALMGDDEQKAFELLKKNRAVQRPIIERYNGRWLKEIGDGVLASFPTVSDAVHCAAIIQKTCQSEPDLKLKIGIHQGEVVFDGMDVFGDGVNIASRIESLTPAGCIYISESVLRNVENKKAIQTKFVGEKELKNVKYPIRIYQVNVDDQAIHEVLESPVPKPIESTEKSIAILPFVNMSNDPEQEYFCDGLSEELLNALTQLDRFKVASRTSSFMFKGKNIDISEIGKKLHVETVLEGSVRKVQNRVRITAQLINAQDGFHLWSERYDRELTDIFEIQDEITLSILDALKLKLLSNERNRILKRSTKNPEAYQLYLKGRQNFHLITPDGYLKAIEFFNTAVEIEPSYSEAIAGIASCYLNLWHFDLVPADQCLQPMIESTYKAIELDDKIAESHLAMARLRMWYEFNLMEAKKEFEITLELNPNIPDAIAHYAFVESCLGNKSKALELGKRALELDPFSPMTILNHAVIFWLCQDLDALEKQAHKIIDLQPNLWGGHYLLGLCYWCQHEYQNAIRSFNDSLDLQPNLWILSFIGCLHAIIGEKDQALSTLAKMDEMTEKKGIASFNYAILYAALADQENAFYYLEKASEERTGLLIFLDLFRFYGLIPAFNDNSRLQDYMDRIGVPIFDR